MVKDELISLKDADSQVSSRKRLANRKQESVASVKDKSQL